ncbi:MAG TPA: imidazole glycerol phosphate synthase subunit HisH [Polyangiaceae bacterium]|nr:imidazole glycerol phosphate synthase subunit HisH [Polyangiaceae bacterium]
MRIVVCDVGLGNLRSVERALQAATLGSRQQVEVSDDPSRVRTADRLIMPGQGAFGRCATALSGGLGDAVRAHLRAGKPYLGICLGLQVLFAASDESPGCAGLGVLDGEVVRLPAGVDASTGGPLKIPHVGWNEADPKATNRGLLEPEPRYYYFVHSFVVVPRDPTVVAATTEYGGRRFVSAVSHGNVFACQFHPEKSQRAGIALLERFAAS